VQPVGCTTGVKLLLGGVQQIDALTNAVESVLVALAHLRVLFTRERF
jgi:S-ribosylhomocysteine lyase LuxS involved in autoinducer biosynthesis